MNKTEMNALIQRTIDCELAPALAQLTAKIDEINAGLARANADSAEAVRLASSAAKTPSESAADGIRPRAVTKTNDIWAGALSELDAPRVDELDIMDLNAGHVTPSEIKKEAERRNAERHPPLPADLRDNGLFKAHSTRAPVKKAQAVPSAPVRWDHGLTTREDYGQTKADTSDLGRIKI